MITFIAIVGYLAAFILSLGMAYWLVKEWPKGGFVLEPNPKDGPPADWKRARNVIMLPIAIYGFYRYGTAVAAPTADRLVPGPWDLLRTEEHFLSLDILKAAVRSFGQFFGFLWQSLSGTVVTVASYVDVVIPIPGVAIALVSIAAFALVVAILMALGDSMVVILTVGAGALILAPVVAQIVFLGVFVVFGIIVPLFVLAFFLTRGQIMDELRR